MDILRSRIDTGSAGFRKNRDDMRALLAEVEAQLAAARAGGGERSVARHRDRGKLPIRERIELLLDRDARFLELSPLAGPGTDFAVGGGFVSGLGVVSGVECVICGHDPTVMGGTITAISGKNIDRALEISWLNRLPYVQFVESAGGDGAP
jgi:acetyl-CoA carboxylase carboxyltransferase component